jgi:predicted neuraminidase
VDIRIGIVNTPRELMFQTTQSAADIEKAIATALAEDSGTLRLEDDKGHIYVVAARNLAFVEIGQEKARKVGFAP